MQPIREFLFFVYTESPYQQIAAGVGGLLVLWGFLWVVARAFAYRWYIGCAVLLLPLLLAGAAVFFGLHFSIDPRFLIAGTILVLVFFPALYAIRAGRAAAIPLVMLLLGTIILAAPGPLDYIGWLRDTRPRIIEVDGRVTLTLTGASDYSELDQLPKLTQLQMANKDVTDAHLAKVANLKELHTLDLDSTGITDAGLAHLSGLPLVTLRLNDTAITTEGFKTHVATIPTLRVVWLRGTSVDYDVAKNWQKEKPKERRAILDPRKPEPKP